MTSNLLCLTPGEFCILDIIVKSGLNRCDAAVLSQKLAGRGHPFFTEVDRNLEYQKYIIIDWPNSQYLITLKGLDIYEKWKPFYEL